MLRFASALVRVVGFAALHVTGRLRPEIWLGSWSIGGAVLHPLTTIYALSGSAMISTIRVPKI